MPRITFNLKSNLETILFDFFHFVNVYLRFILCTFLRTYIKGSQTGITTVDVFMNVAGKDKSNV